MVVREQQLDELKASVNLVHLIQRRGMALKRQGSTYVGLCPFHAETTPSFVVNPKENLWHCFGCPDHKGGDALTFLQLVEHLSFPEAVEQLKKEAGNGKAVPSGKAVLAPPPPARRAGNPQALLNRVVEWYQKTFLEDPRGLEYLQSRNLVDRDLCESFQIGFVNGSILSTLPADGEITKQLRDVGVLTRSGRELFLNCVTFPIFNEDHQVVGMYGRRVDPENAVQHLYLPGPHRGVFNWQAAKRSSDLILTESILDCLSLYQAGFKDCIPLYGTNGLTADHLELFSKHSVKKVFCCLDDDEAGRAAATRVAEKLKPLGIACAEIVLPVKDANEYFQSHSAEDFVALIEEARPLTEEGEKVLPVEEGFTLTLGAVTYTVKLVRAVAEQLRVTLKAVCGEQLHTDTLDLYAHKARQSFLNCASKTFKIPREELEPHLNRLLLEAERWKRQQTAQEVVKEKPGDEAMSEAEREDAVRFLSSPTLVAEILADLECCGYVGEASTKLLAYLIGISRKLETPLSGILISQSGAGKSQLAELIEALTPPEEVVLYSRLSPQALCYMERDFLKRKLLIIEERTGSEAADYSIRTLQTRAKITQGVVIKDPQTGRMYTKTTTVEGPIAYLVTTTSRASLNHENLTRCFEIDLDESKEQTLRIHAQQRQAKTVEGLVLQEHIQQIKRKHQQAQRLLQTVKVVIPFAPLLSFPAEWLRSRRDHGRFLSLIEVVAFLHQVQREKKRVTDEQGKSLEYLEATLEDYRMAYGLAQEVLVWTFQELSKGASELLTMIEELVEKRRTESQVEPSEVVFTRRLVREFTSWPDHRVKEGCKELEELEYVTVVSARNGKASQYTLPAVPPAKTVFLSGLTTPEELEERVTRRPPGTTGPKGHH